MRRDQKLRDKIKSSCIKIYLLKGDRGERFIAFKEANQKEENQTTNGWIESAKMDLYLSCSFL